MGADDSLVDLILNVGASRDGNDAVDGDLAEVLLPLRVCELVDAL